MVAPFSGAGTPVRPGRIEGAEDGNEETDKESCAPTEIENAPTEIDEDESVAPTEIDEEEEKESSDDHGCCSRTP